MAVVSNFDLRLRPLLEALGLDRLFDALIISAEVSMSRVPALQCPPACKGVPCCRQDCSKRPNDGHCRGVCHIVHRVAKMAVNAVR